MADAGEVASGISSNTVHRWEAGLRRPEPRYRRHPVIVFGLPASRLGLLSPDELALASGVADEEGDLQRLTLEPFIQTLATYLDLPLATAYSRVARRAAALRRSPATLYERRLARSGVSTARIAEALASYYKVNSLADDATAGMYVSRLADYSVPTSIWTRRAWCGLALPVPGPTFLSELETDVPSVHHSLGAAGSIAVNRLAEAEALDLVLFDNPIFRLLSFAVHDATATVRFGISRFSDYFFTSDLLETELLDVLADGEYSETSALPARAAFLPSLDAVFDFERRVCGGGPICLFAFAMEDGSYSLTLQTRSPTVANANDRISVIPKAFHQPFIDAGVEVSLDMTIRRELEEEVLGRSDELSGSPDDRQFLDPFHDSRISPPMAWLLQRWGHDAVQCECVAVGINLVSGNYELAHLIAVHDPAWWKRFGGEVRANWEARRLMQVSSDDAAGVSALLARPDWTNEGLFAFTQAAVRLRETIGNKHGAALPQEGGEM